MLSWIQSCVHMDGRSYVYIIELCCISVCGCGCDAYTSLHTTGPEIDRQRAKLLGRAALCSPNALCFAGQLRPSSRSLWTSLNVFLPAPNVHVHARAAKAVKVHLCYRRHVSTLAAVSLPVEVGLSLFSPLLRCGAPARMRVRRCVGGVNWY